MGLIPNGLCEFFIDITILAALWPWKWITL